MRKVLFNIMNVLFIYFCIRNSFLVYLLVMLFDRKVRYGGLEFLVWVVYGLRI